MRRLHAALAALFLFAVPLAAQPRPVLTPAAYDRWQVPGAVELSPDGRWIAYELRRVDEDVELRLRPTSADTGRAIAHARSAAFSADGRWVGYLVGAARAEEERAQQAGKPLRARLELVDLRTGAVHVTPGIGTFQFSGDGRYLALRGYLPEGHAGPGFDLVVRDLASGLDTNFGNIAEFAWQDDGALLAMVVAAHANAGNGVRLYDPRTGMLRTLASDTASWSGLVWRRDGDDFAVLRAVRDSAYADVTHDIVAWTSLASGPVEHRFVGARVDGFPADTRIMAARPLSWSEDGATVFFGIRERVRRSAADSAASRDSAVAAAPGARSDSATHVAPSDSAKQAGDSGRAGVEVWHARDVDIIPEQKVRAARDRERSRLAAWHLRDGRFVALGSERLEEAVVAPHAAVALGLDGTPWERERMFGPAYRDLYVIDVHTGSAQQVAERVEFQYGLSATGRYLLYLRADHYHVWDRQTGRTINLTADLPTTFVNRNDDHTVSQKPPWGTGGWLADDRAVLLYDEYDIWEVRPDGSGGVNLTNGTAERLRHRRVWLDPVLDRTVDPARPFYVSLYGERSKQYGYGRLERGRPVERLVLLDRNVSRLIKAKAAETYVYRVEGFADSPDWFVAGAGLTDARQVSRTNPFMGEYAWGRAELVDYVNARGDSLQAALLYPANWEPGQRYPLLVYPYERTSSTLHTFAAPSERTPYNTTVFTQNGYFVLRPDIRYRGRDPGISAIESLLPAVDRVLATGMVDSAKVGLVGHSWGAYQTAFAVTQTDRFAAAVAGAPLTNLISMYLSIYWNTGGTDARIFEIQQGRMEVPPWEDLEAYIRNSPLFSIERLETPLLVAFGDKDGAVDWHQGIELYNAARRAGKPLVMLVYEGENHSLAKPPNQVDYHRRILQWFGHHLKGEPAPAWMESGVKYLEQD
ncbi:MAG TPA: prolyl oligopeptidase family serine peptidase [Longimicrobiales bacterium]|nr:prolyl oligopeptidase family serine peptidase [Longimicrobiales bacterium]